MTPTVSHAAVMSVTEAAGRGLPGLVKDVERGEDILVARRGQPVAALVSIRRLDQLRALEADLRDIALVLARAATDTGTRLGLDEAITAFGFDRSELESELARDLAAGRE
ncbi:MAG: type II toxin-antitoxin system Phd/YefM family antitoxin [Mycobacteriales bacterium]